MQIETCTKPRFQNEQSTTKGPIHKLAPHRLFTLLFSLLFATVLTGQASALYDPGVGRFCSRDPIGYEDGAHLYHYAKDSPISSLDPHGTLSIFSGVPRFEPCGGLVHRAVWKLDEGEENGWIVQRVCYSDVVLPCCDRLPVCKSLLPKAICPNTKVCNDGCYIEAWAVENRKAADIDTFAFPRCEDSLGFRIQIGHAIFVPKHERLIPSEGVARACSLPSACLESPGVQEYWNEMWNKYGKASTLRYSFTAWNCCNSRKTNYHYSIAF